MSENFDWKMTRNTSRSQVIQGLDTNIHCLAVELSEWITYHLLIKQSKSYHLLKNRI